MTSMSAKSLWLCVGLAGGVLLTLGLQYALRKPDEPARADPELARLRQAVATERERGEAEVAKAQAELAKVQTEAAAQAAANEKSKEALEKLKAELASAQDLPAKAPAKAGAPSTSPPTDDELMKGIGDFGASLGAILQGGGEDAKKAIRDLLARAGKHGIDLLVAKFKDDATDMQLRVVLAHALAQSGNEEAITTLKNILADPETGLVELRFASHGLAFSDAPGIDDALLGVASRAADTGARANAAFGLARRKNPAGIDLYAKATDEAMANRDPAALQYLSGFYLLGDEALPPMRERLLTYTEPQAVLTLIEILKMKGDKGALENLKKLAADEGKPESIRKSAAGAIKALEGAGK